MTERSRLSAVASPTKLATLERRREAFAQLFDEHWGRVRHHIECFVEDHDEVDDLLADVFGVAWEKLKPDHPMGLPWLLRTADNKLRDRDRRARTRERAMPDVVRRAAPKLYGFDHADRFAVREALAVLSDTERRVVILTYWDELAAGEIAEILRCSQGAVWTALSRARTKLRTVLALADGGEHGPE